MNGGTFEDFSQVYGGCVYVSSGSTFNMYDGTIKSGNAEYGGAIYIADGGTANIYAGSIESNKAVRNLTTSTGGNGGAIYVANGGTLNLLGGTISGSEADVYGGAIYVEQGGKLKITGGELSENIATTGGGAIYTLSPQQHRGLSRAMRKPQQQADHILYLLHKPQKVYPKPAVRETQEPRKSPWEAYSDSPGRNRAPHCIYK